MTMVMTKLAIAFLKVFFAPLLGLWYAVRTHSFHDWYHNHFVEFWGVLCGAIAANSGGLAIPSWMVLTETDMHAAFIGVLAIIGKAFLGGATGGIAGSVIKWIVAKLSQLRTWIKSKISK